MCNSYIAKELHVIPGIGQVFHVIPEIFWTFYAYFLTKSL